FMNVVVFSTRTLPRRGRCPSIALMEGDQRPKSAEVGIHHSVEKVPVAGFFTAERRQAAGRITPPVSAPRCRRRDPIVRIVAPGYQTPVRILTAIVIELPPL